MGISFLCTCDVYEKKVQKTKYMASEAYESNVTSEDAYLRIIYRSNTYFTSCHVPDQNQKNRSAVVSPDAAAQGSRMVEIAQIATNVHNSQKINTLTLQIKEAKNSLSKGWRRMLNSLSRRKIKSQFKQLNCQQMLKSLKSSECGDPGVHCSSSPLQADDAEKREEKKREEEIEKKRTEDRREEERVKHEEEWDEGKAFDEKHDMMSQTYAPGKTNPYRKKTGGKRTNRLRSKKYKR